MADTYELDWQGDRVLSAVLEKLVPVMGRIGLEVEGEAKKDLTKGHGVLTGTLRRSIHCAEEGYDWLGDDIEPSKESPERGKQTITPEPEKGDLVVEVGSGMSYALAVHQGHHDFQGYHYLTNGLDRTRPKIPGILQAAMR